MNKKIGWGAVVILILILFGVWLLKFRLVEGDKKTLVSLSEANRESKLSYWTCPMHPQVHQDHPGECPICHMKLVKVLAQDQDLVDENNTQESSRSVVQVNSSQMKLLGIQQQKVERKDMTALIPISGRLISPSSVAFQVYESDLREVRVGLAFQGTLSTDVDEDIYGKISSVDTIADPTSRTVRVVGNLNKGSQRPISETSFRGEIRIELKNRLVIAESSVLHTGKEDLVYVFDKNAEIHHARRLTPRRVKLGVKAGGLYEVLSGLEEEDVISSGPNFLIDSEAKIRGAND